MTPPTTTHTIINGGIMKKISLTLLALLLAFAFACSKPAQNPYDPEMPKSGAENTAAPNDSGEPPAMISCQSLLEYPDFGASVVLPDDEFSEFMHSHGFDMSGVDSKEDAERIISLLDNVALPDFSGYKYYMSSLRFDNNAFTIWYSRADEDICCMSVTIIVTESLPAEELKKYKNSSVYSLISCDADSTLPFLAYVTEKDEHDTRYNTSRYVTNIDSRAVFIIINQPENDFLNRLQHCRLITFAQYAGR